MPQFVYPCSWAFELFLVFGYFGSEHSCTSLFVDTHIQSGWNIDKESQKIFSYSVWWNCNRERNPRLTGLQDRLNVSPLWCITSFECIHYMSCVKKWINHGAFSLVIDCLAGREAPNGPRFRLTGEAEILGSKATRHLCVEERTVGFPLCKRNPEFSNWSWFQLLGNSLGRGGDDVPCSQSLKLRVRRSLVLKALISPAMCM